MLISNFGCLGSLSDLGKVYQTKISKQMILINKIISKESPSPSFVAAVTTGGQVPQPQSIVRFLVGGYEVC